MGLKHHAVLTHGCEFKPFLHVTWPKAEGQHFDKLTQLCVALIAHMVSKKALSGAQNVVNLKMF